MPREVVGKEDESSDGPKKVKKHKKHKHKTHRTKRKHSSSPERSKRSKRKVKKTKNESDENSSSNEDIPGPSIPKDFKTEQTKVPAPMTKEQWEEKRNVIRKVYDEETGRQRLVRGDGEILEEIVSKKRHAEINKQATAGDGNFFQKKLGFDG